MNPPIRAAVMTVSDACARSQATDTTGPALAAILRDRLHAEVVATACVPCEASPIANQLSSWAVGNGAIDLILTIGGTGLGPHDITPEATLRNLDREHPSLMQLLHMRCAASTPRTFLSRGVAGTISTTLVINLPGSTQGAVEGLSALLDVLPSAIQMLRGQPGEEA
jgi:molybdenum cofactor synthesis domain-containing protein